MLHSNKAQVILSVSRRTHMGIAVLLSAFLLHLSEVSHSPQCPRDMETQHRRLPLTPESTLQAQLRARAWGHEAGVARLGSRDTWRSPGTSLNCRQSLACLTDILFPGNILTKTSLICDHVLDPMHSMYSGNLYGPCPRDTGR